jgi:hypothetical protein
LKMLMSSSSGSSHTALLFQNSIHVHRIPYYEHPFGPMENWAKPSYFAILSIAHPNPSRLPIIPGENIGSRYFFCIDPWRTQ